MPSTVDPSGAMKSYWNEVRALAKREKISLAEARQRVRKAGVGQATGGSTAAKSNGRVSTSTRREPVSKDQLKEELRALANRLGRAPTQRDIDQASKKGQAHSVKTYRRHFQSLSKAIEQAGIGSARAASASAQRTAAPPRQATGDATPAGQFELAHRFVAEIGGIDQARLWVDCVEAATRVSS